MKFTLFYKFILFFSLIICTYTIGFGNTRSYCEEQLRLAEIERINENYVKSLEILLEIKPVIENNNWTDLQLRTLHNIGLMYAMILNYDKSLEYFIESYKLAIQTSDKLQEIRILNNISHIYYATDEIEKAKEYIGKAYEGAVLLNDSARMGKFAGNLGFLANETGDLDLAEKYLDLAITSFKYRPNDTISWINTHHEKGRNLYLKKKYAEAEKLLLEILETHSHKKYNDPIAECLLTLSKVYQGKKDIPKSIHYAKDGLNKTSSLLIKIPLYQQLSNVYKENNSYLLSLQYLDSMVCAKDSLVKLNDRAQTLNNQTRFDLLNTEKELVENKAKQRSERLLFIVIILSIFILTITLFWLLRVQSIRNKQRKIITENKQKIIELELKEEKNDKLLLEQQLKEQETFTLLEQERLSNEIELKNNQLVAKALFQSNRNKLIKEIISTLSEIPDYSENPIVASMIRKLKIQLKDSAELDNFVVDFQQINPTLFSLLKGEHPNLNADDIRLLSYIYLYLDTKKIAHLLNITSDTYRKRKERLAKKMNIETTDLYDYLLNTIKSSLHK